MTFRDPGFNLAIFGETGRTWGDLGKISVHLKYDMRDLAEFQVQ